MTVTWQGETVTGPLMIYHSEIKQTASLTCSHPTGPVAWHLANGNILLNSGGTFNNIITNGGRQAQVRHGHDGGNETLFDGLWTCRLDGATGAGAFHVGIYDDTPPTGKISSFQVDFPQQILNFRVHWGFKSPYSWFIPSEHVTK